MPAVTKTVELQGTPEEAFALATDFARFGEWLSWHDSWPDGEPSSLEPGKTFTQRMKMGGMPADITWTVAELDDTHVKLAGSMMGAQLANIIATSASDGGATVSFTAEFSGGAMMGPMGKMVEQQTSNELDKSLKKLKGMSA